jgi:hypothetical protein
MPSRGAMMGDAIRASVVDHLVEGKPVEEAYRLAADEANALAKQMIDRGGKTNEALESLGIVDTGRHRFYVISPFKRHAMYMIVSGGGVADVPDAACMQEKLAGKPNPTRDEVEAAVAACTK